MADNLVLIGRILQKYHLLTVQEFSEIIKVHGQMDGRVSMAALLEDRGHLTSEQVSWLTQAVRHYEQRAKRDRTRMRPAPPPQSSAPPSINHTGQEPAVEDEDGDASEPSSATNPDETPAQGAPETGPESPSSSSRTVFTDTLVSDTAPSETGATAEPVSSLPLEIALVDDAAILGDGLARAPAAEEPGPLSTLPPVQSRETAVPGPGPAEPANLADDHDHALSEFTVEPTPPEPPFRPPPQRPVLKGPGKRVAIGILRPRPRFAANPAPEPRSLPKAEAESAPSESAVPLSPPSLPTLAELLREGAQRKASDLHLHVGLPPMVRLAGSLRPLDHQPLLSEHTEAFLGSVLSQEQQRHLQDSGEVSLVHEIPEVGRFRGSALRQHRGYDLSFRMVPLHVPPLEELGLGELRRALGGVRSGLVLCTGPKGAGKTTTLAAVCRFFQESRAGRTLTIEDPIEFLQQGPAIVHQRQVGIHTRSVEAALLAALHEDYDLIAIDADGLRERRSLRLALTLSEAGRLVLCTVPAGNVTRTIEWILGRFPHRRHDTVLAILGRSLVCIVSQRLLRRQDDERGDRVLCQEVLHNNARISTLIRNGRIADLPLQMLKERASGMCLLDESLAELQRTGAVSQEEALRQAQIPYLSN